MIVTFLEVIAWGLCIVGCAIVLGCLVELVWHIGKQLYWRWRARIIPKCIRNGGWIPFDGRKLRKGRATLDGWSIEYVDMPSLRSSVGG